MQEIIPLELHEPLRRLARVGPWFSVRNGTGTPDQPDDPRPRTWILPDLILAAEFGVSRQWVYCIRKMAAGAGFVFPNDAGT